MTQTMKTSCGVEIDTGVVAEWVGQHYGRNFDAEPEAKRQEWVDRFAESHDLGVKSMTIVVGAYATNESGDSPTYAAISVDEALLAKVSKLMTLCAAHELTQVRVVGYPEWGPKGIEDELRLQDGEMIVKPSGSVQFTDYPKNCSYRIESRGTDITALMETFNAAAHGAVVFLTDDKSISEQYAADDEAAETD